MVPSEVPLDVESMGCWSLQLVSLQGCVGDLDLGVKDPRALEVLGWASSWRILISGVVPSGVSLDVEIAGYWSLRLMPARSRGVLDLGMDDLNGPTGRGEGGGLAFVSGEALRGPWGGSESRPGDPAWWTDGDA